jgi:hypothetical protein
VQHCRVPFPHGQPQTLFVAQPPQPPKGYALSQTGIGNRPEGRGDQAAPWRENPSSAVKSAVRSALILVATSCQRLVEPHRRRFKIWELGRRLAAGIFAVGSGGVDLHVGSESHAGAVKRRRSNRTPQNAWIRDGIGPAAPGGHRFWRAQYVGADPGDLRSESLSGHARDGPSPDRSSQRYRPHGTAFSDAVDYGISRI